MKRLFDFFGSDSDDNPNSVSPIIQASGYDEGELTRVCPHCGEEKPMSEFGLRDMGNGTIRNQSWCKDCR
jgi:hypothetical protein